MIKERFERLKDVLDRSALAKHEARVGRREEVLVEGPSRRNDADALGTHPSRQADPLRRERRSACAPGALVMVDVMHGAPYHLLGELSRSCGPRHKVRIALLNS